MKIFHPRHFCFVDMVGLELNLAIESLRLRW